MIALETENVCLFADVTDRVAKHLDILEIKFEFKQQTRHMFSHNLAIFIKTIIRQCEIRIDQFII